MRSLLLSLLTAVTIAASGCASAPLTRAEVDGRVVCNADRMDQVEREARRAFKEVHWIHCPQAVLRAM